MIFRKILLIVCALFLAGLPISLHAFADESHETDPGFKEVAIFFPIDGGRLHIGNVDRDTMSFRLHLSHFGKDSEKIFYYADSGAFVDEDGQVEPDNTVACVEYPQYTNSVIGTTYRRARVRILFSQRGEGNGFFKEAGHVIYEKCATNKPETGEWKCTGWEYLGRLPGF